MNCFHIFPLVSVKTVTQFVKVTHARQACIVRLPSWLKLTLILFPDYTNTSALITVIYWCVMVIALHLTTKWPQSLHSSIFPDTPKVTLINQLIHTQPCSVKLCLLHLCLLSVYILNLSPSLSQTRCFASSFVHVGSSVLAVCLFFRFHDAIQC